MSIGGGKNDQNQTAMADPMVQASTWNAIQEGWKQYNDMPLTPEFYRGDTVADMDGRQERALDLLYKRGRDGSAEQQFLEGQLGADWESGLAGAQSGLQGLASGQAGPYSDAVQEQASGAVNPLVDAMYRDAASNLNESFQEGVVPGINATFARAGRTGAQGDALANAAGELADAQSSLATNMYGQAAESALSRQLQAGLGGLSSQLGALGTMQSGALGGMGAQQQAAGMSDAMTRQGFQDALQAGDRYQAQDQAEIDANRERYEHNVSRGIQDHQRRLGTLGAITGTTAPLAGTGRTFSSGSGKGWGLGK